MAKRESAFDRQVGGDHYKKMGIQPFLYALENDLRFAEGEIIKRLSIWREHGGLEELRKAQHELAMLVEFVERNN